MFKPFLSIGITDVIDILFVAVLLYTAITWLRTTRAAFVVRGLFMLGAVYILARQLDLQLTAWIFQGFFAIFLIIIVVIFQEELRQIFERIAIWSLAPKGAPSLRPDVSDILVRTLADLAKERVGALVVVCGKDPIARHITGGIELEGRISEPLLRSIFDPHSPGHDGAVIIEGNAITRFAAHLPLSTNFQQLANVGTRHGAALGLAELSDAMCIVVSEERGNISVAADGRLRRIDNLQELGSLIQKFLDKKYPPPDAKRLSTQLLRENWVTKAVTLVLAIGLWFVLVPGSKTIEVTYQLPVEVQNLPQELSLEEVRPSEVSATFTGPMRAFYFFDATKLKVTVDASVAQSGQRTFRISEQNVRHPKGVTLQQVSPSSLRITVKRASSGTAGGRG
ncbi:MAG TPA: diadenylate cyclase [Candidatus Binatia bacterium]|nr:diadenylate cyclase [Candidatus Binatia bacterium]